MRDFQSAAASAPARVEGVWASGLRAAAPQIVEHGTVKAATGNVEGFERMGLDVGSTAGPA